MSWTQGEMRARPRHWALQEVSEGKPQVRHHGAKPKEAEEDGQQSCRAGKKD